MGVKFTIANQVIEPIEYSITEEATPIRGGDSYGAVSILTVKVPTGSLRAMDLIDTQARLDTDYGWISGIVDSCDRSDDGATISLVIPSMLSQVAVYNITAKPFVGTLQAAIRSYVALGDSTLSVSVASSVANKQVALIGWTGELWHHLKQLAVAYGLEVALVSGVITFRTPRALTLEHSRLGSSQVSYGDNDRADKAELYWYKTRPVNNAPVYPPNLDVEFAQTYSIPAGEETEIVLELETSVSYIAPPVYRESVPPTWFSGSAISLARDDDTIISLAEWNRGGGAVRVKIEDDQMSVRLIIRGPTNASASTFKLVAPANISHAERSSIRLHGTGVAFRRNRCEVLTGVKPNTASSEMAPTQDNIFINDASTAWDLCTSMAQYYTAPRIKSNTDTPSFGVTSPLGGVIGGRYYDTKARQWFRVRSLSYGPGTVGVVADWDTTHVDAQAMYAGMTYAQVQALHSGKTYGRVTIEGVTRG